MTEEKNYEKQLQQFKTPEEELHHLREQVAEKERELETIKEKPTEEEITRERVAQYGEREPEEVLAPEYRFKKEEIEGIALDLAPEEHDAKMNELLGILEEKGIRNALSIVHKLGNPHIEDDFHRILVQYLKKGFSAPGLKEKGDLWNVLHMTLYEITLPEVRKEDIAQKNLKELLSSMEQFYAGMLSNPQTRIAEPRHFTFEIALADKSDEVIFYASIPDYRKDLFEKQLLSLFPDAQISEQKNDYNVFVDGGEALGSRGETAKHGALPLKTYDQFDNDPLNVILNAFSKIEKDGGGAAVQFVFHPEGDRLNAYYKDILKKLQKGESLNTALKTPQTIAGEFLRDAKGAIFGMPSSKKEGEEARMSMSVDQTAVEQIQNKIAVPLATSNIRIIASAGTKERAEEILSHLESAFNQFENTMGNRLKFSRVAGGKRAELLNDFSFRTFRKSHAVSLNIRELTTLIHLPSAGVETPQFKQARSGVAAAPVNLPQEGTLLGVNNFRNVETKVYLTKEDRLRHFYCIGQTGTGKTTLLKNMIAQDIAQGEGVCMIDPHGTDILDVLAMVPEERYDDVIYFDPSHTERVMGLNMLEYDQAYPEQKTFVVNELFSIFQKLYGAIPESMGPVFEQYFRNATMLVLEDPSSGSTLLDVSRVLADANFRAFKLSKCNNPVVSQFWEEIASKASGEQSLANIVPYITGKFDVFTANDYMRPIIAQQKSSFNFRQIMDERKILLVNLAKGRLGDINSNLLGLILVGKILVAALSRVDAVGKEEMNPFYLYIDEFQNVTTDSISTILSEARKYKLSMTVAHQFIAQLDEKIRDAVFGNVGSMAVFRVGSDDAQFLESQFEPVFTANDLLNIENRNAYIKLLADGQPVKPMNISILPPVERNMQKVEELKQHSYEKFGKPREEIEAKIKAKFSPKV